MQLKTIMATQLLKGMLSCSGAKAGLVQQVVFQFNPESISRLQVYSDKGNSVTESISFELVFNASAGMEDGVAEAVENGIYPQLAALEELMVCQKKMKSIGRPGRLLRSKIIHFLALTYGDRIIPVKIQRLNINEVLHNNELKPIHATVDIALRVLTKRELRGNADALALLAAYRKYRRLKAQLS